jgi:four helix bundle protein
MSQTYRDLIAWQKSMDLVTAIYQATRAFPREELYGLTSQLRRAAVSIPSNIAEGQARYSHAEFHHFLRNARGSLAEVETQIQIACNLKYIQEEQAQPLLHATAELGRILNALLDSVKKRAAGTDEN